MSDADQAYKAAQEKIARVKAAGGTLLDLSGEAFRALEVLPPEIAELTTLQRLDLARTQVSDLTSLRGLTALQRLYLDQTQVSDLTPLRGLSALQVLWLNQTQVSDLTPLRGLSALQVLQLIQTQVSDLRPLLSLEGLRQGAEDRKPLAGLYFKDCPALRTDPALQELSKIDDRHDRILKVLDYLATLPPWPEPLPGMARGGENRAAEQVQTAEAHIAFLLDHAATTRTQADVLAGQIRHALRNVPATDGNKLPPVLQSMENVATILKGLSVAPIEDRGPTSEKALKAEIARLEAEIATLSERLADSDKAREAAEALAKANSTWSQFKGSAAKTAGVGCVGLLSVGVPTAAVYFLGTENAVVNAFLTVVGKLPK